MGVNVAKEVTTSKILPSFGLSGKQQANTLLQAITSSVTCHVQLFVTPQTAANQAYLSLPISQSLPKLLCLIKNQEYVANRLWWCFKREEKIFA